MEDNTYIKYTRALHNNANFKSLSYQYRHIFVTILVNMAFKPIRLNDHGHPIELRAGQMMTTYRQLVKLCDEDDIDLPKVQRALRRFEELGFSRQETIHTKTIITITEPSICESLINEADTHFDTRSIQDRYKIDTQKKNIKEIKELKEEHTQGECAVSSSKENISQEPKKLIPSTYKSQTYRPKNSYGQTGLVLLYPEEYERLTAKDGLTPAERDYWIEQVEATMQRQGIAEFNKKNQSHYWAIKSWISYRQRSEKVVPIVRPEVKEMIKKTSCKALAEQTLKDYYSENYQLEICYNSIEIKSKIPHISHVDILKFNENGFENQLRVLLEKRGFERIRMRERA
jgi:hypothetical protein